MTTEETWLPLQTQERQTWETTRDTLSSPNTAN